VKVPSINFICCGLGKIVVGKTTFSMMDDGTLVVSDLQETKLIQRNATAKKLNGYFMGLV
jgi:hypothetical protein